MEFHTCENCCLIDEVINKQLKKYEVLTKENLSLHDTLIKSKDTIIRMESELTNLRDGLIAERQRNLQLYLEQYSNFFQKSQASVNIIVNPEPEELHRSKLSNKLYARSVPTSAKDNKIDYVPLSKYNELISLVDKQKDDYETDLELLKSLSNKCHETLKQELANMRSHLATMLDLYETSQKYLYEERHKNIECHKLLQEAIKAMNLLHTKQLEDIKRKMMAKATNTANALARETVSVMKTQLDDRDKLVTKLRHQQVKLEEYLERQEQELHTQQQNHKQAISELQKQVTHARSRYSKLELRRSLESQGFHADVTNIRKAIKQIKNKLCSPKHNSKNFSDIQKLEEQVDHTKRKLQSTYSL